jgi:hypothetical protein
MLKSLETTDEEMMLRINMMVAFQEAIKPIQELNAANY